MISEANLIITSIEAGFSIGTVTTAFEFLISTIWKPHFNSLTLLIACSISLIVLSCLFYSDFICDFNIFLNWFISIKGPFIFEIVIKFS